MPALSKKQQRFMGMVYATKKGEMDNPSPEVQKAADSMKKSDAKDFASTKHKGLPEKKVAKEEVSQKNRPSNIRKKAKLTVALKKLAKRRAMSEESNPRIPRKPGQPAGSKKHSDLYTDENPKGTIHGLGFKDVATAKASVSKIRNSSRSHAHKIQAAVAMEQRAREMGKTSEAAVYRKYINSMKKKTKKMNEEKHSDHEPEMIRNQLKTAKRASKRIKSHTLKKDNFKAWVQSKITKASDYLDTAADYLDSKDDMKEEKKKVIMSPVMLAMLKLADAKKRNKNALLNLKYVGEESNPRIPRKKGQPANSKKHSDLYTDENPKGTIHGLGFKDVATAKASVAKIRKSNRSHAHKIQAAVAMEQRAREMGKTSEAAVYRKFINSMKKKTKK